MTQQIHLYHTSRAHHTPQADYTPQTRIMIIHPKQLICTQQTKHTLEPHHTPETAELNIHSSYLRNLYIIQNVVVCAYTQTSAYTASALGGVNFFCLGFRV